MSPVTVHLPDCPNCGAPLELKRVCQGAIDCPYCGKTIAVRSLPTLAADPAAIEALERRAAPPTLAASLFRAAAKYLQVPVAFGAAGSLVATWFVFLRNPHHLSFLWAIVAAVGALLALAWKRRLAAIALTTAVGGLTTLKPFLVPIVDRAGPLSPNSETAWMFYLIPGTLLLGVGAIAVFRIRPARFRTDLALLRPTLPTALGFLAGAALAVWACAGPTNRDLLDEHAGRLAAFREAYGELGRAISTDPEPALPDRREGLDPLPRFVPGDGASNTDFAPLAELGYTGHRATVDPFLRGDLSTIFARARERWNRDDWEFDESLARQIARALATRYVAAGGCANRDDSDDVWDDCVVWLMDLRTRRPLLRATVPAFTTNSFVVGREMLDVLQRATGGTFRDAE